ncbi:hypothetical protein ACPUEJ_20060 [Vibrio tubiashii]|uniref:hypothetical protein n=1 Tax=Vibrio tubiashii TaxID=29498 RepID=UPI003CE48540
MSDIKNDSNESESSSEATLGLDGAASCLVVSVLCVSLFVLSWKLSIGFIGFIRTFLAFPFLFGAAAAILASIGCVRVTIFSSKEEASEILYNAFYAVTLMIASYALLVLFWWVAPEFLEELIKLIFQSFRDKYS